MNDDLDDSKELPALTFLYPHPSVSFDSTCTFNIIFLENTNVVIIDDSVNDNVDQTSASTKQVCNLLSCICKYV